MVFSTYDEFVRTESLCQSRHICNINSYNILFINQSFHLESESSKKSIFFFPLSPGPWPSFWKYFGKVPACDANCADVIWTLPLFL
jgi:hypothetical protein